MAKLNLPKTSAPRAPAPPKPAVPAPPAPSLKRSKSDSLKKTKSVTSAMASLKNSADQLNHLTDKASETIRSVEEFLVTDCSIGFHASVETGQTDPSTMKYLAFRRIGNHFRIAVIFNSSGQFRQAEVKAWSDCSREIKIESILLLPALIQVITEMIEKDIARAETANDIAVGVLNSLTGNEG